LVVSLGSNLLLPLAAPTIAEIFSTLHLLLLKLVLYEDPKAEENSLLHLLPFVVFTSGLNFCRKGRCPTLAV